MSAVSDEQALEEYLAYLRGHLHTRRALHPIDEIDLRRCALTEGLIPKKCRLLELGLHLPWLPQRPTAKVVLDVDGERREAEACGDGSWEAAYAAVSRAAGCTEFDLTDLGTQMSGFGGTALAEVQVTVARGTELYSGTGVSGDTNKAFVLAVVAAFNRVLAGVVTRYPVRN